MLSRPIKAALTAACLLPAPFAEAQSVLLQQFVQRDNKTKGIVLAPIRQPTTTNDLAASMDLATDFADIGAGNDQPPWNPTNRLAQSERSQRRHLNRRWLAATFSGCATENYRPNPALPAMAERRRATWYNAMASAACEAGIPVNLLDALVIAESRYNPAALSPKGAAGLAQLMPDSAQRFGVSNVWDPNANLRGGARLLRTLLDEFGRFDLALAAYNAGAGRVRATGRVPRIPETVRYVSTILVTMRDQFLRNGGNPP